MMAALHQLSAEESLNGLAEPTLGKPASGECLAFVSDNQTHGAITAVCEPRFPGFRVRDGGSREALEHLADGATPKLLIIDVSDTSNPLTALLPIIASFAEQTRLIAIGTANDITLYREMIEAGVAEYLVKPVTEKALIGALARLDDKPAEAAAAVASERRPVIAVVGTRGGVGASTLAINCAWLAAHEFKRRAALLDLDLQYGTVALALDIEPTHGLREALENPSRIDSLFINSATVKIGERLSVMAAEETPDIEVAYDPAAIDLLIDELARQADCLIVDVPRSFAAARARVLASATKVLVVTDLSLAGLRDAIRIQGQIQMLAPQAQLIYVANHSGGREGGVPRAEFERALGHKLDFLVPDDPKAAATAGNSGKPIVAVAPNSKVAAPLKTIVAGFCETAAADAKKARRRLWPLRRK
jgi:pilus assembly protein CpaE